MVKLYLPSVNERHDRKEHGMADVWNFNFALFGLGHIPEKHGPEVGRSGDQHHAVRIDYLAFYFELDIA